MKRHEFGVVRTSCTCGKCVRFCEHMPGYLIPADLPRMVGNAEPLAWAREHLRASPGALMKNLKTGQTFRVPTLVPAHRPDGSCHFLDGRRCTVHAVSPFGCSMFGCGAKREEMLANRGIHAVMDAMADAGSLYHRVWELLAREGLVSPSPEEKRAALAASLLK
jgi:Fe-S-cluster containining protein